jgi:hypothetical protein
MARFHGPRVVTNGLVLHLDAANIRSYPGSGTTWTDVSQSRAADVTLSNGAVYDASNSGNIFFDGTNDYANFNAPNLGTTTTVEMWAKFGSSFSDGMPFGWNAYTIWCDSGRLGYNTGNGDLYGISAATVTSLGLVNNWRHYVYEMRSDVAYTNNKIYINAISRTLSQQLGTENGANRSFNNGDGRIAIWRASLSTYFIDMNCAIFKVYNRALTQAEINQNFNALRGRFGV